MEWFNYLVWRLVEINLKYFINLLTCVPSRLEELSADGKWFNVLSARPFDAMLNWKYQSIYNVNSEFK